MAETTQGGVYVLRYRGMLKVGSSVNLKRRLAAQRVMLRGYILVGIMPTPYPAAIEVKMHSALECAINRTPGYSSLDWFKDTPRNREILIELGMIEIGVSCRILARAL